MYAPLHEAKKREWLDFHKLSSQGGFFFLKLTQLTLNYHLVYPRHCLDLGFSAEGKGFNPNLREG